MILDITSLNRSKIETRNAIHSKEYSYQVGIKGKGNIVVFNKKFSFLEYFI